MSQFSRLIQKDILADIGSTSAGSSEVLDLFGEAGGASKLSCQATYDVSAPSAKTFDSGKQAVLTNQSVTYTANDRGTDGNSITVTLIDPGDVDIPLSIDVTGTDIVVTLETDGLGVILTTASDLVAAINLDVPASDLITASGSGILPLTALTETPLATGANSEVDIDENSVTIPSHSFPVGFKVRLTTTGTLPAGLATGTDYFIIVVDASTIKFASSLVNALAGTAVNITNQGSNGAVNTVTGVALAGASVTFQKSNAEDGPWVNIQAATTISSDGSVMLRQPDVDYRYFKAVKALTAGVVSLQALTLVIGDAE
jgi:hypothetical protein